MECNRPLKENILLKFLTQLVPWHFCWFGTTEKILHAIWHDPHSTKPHKKIVPALHSRGILFQDGNTYLHRFVLQHDTPPGMYNPQGRYFLVEKYDSHPDMRCKCWFHLVNLQACTFLVDKLSAKENRKEFSTFTSHLAYLFRCVALLFLHYSFIYSVSLRAGAFST